MSNFSAISWREQVTMQLANNMYLSCTGSIWVVKLHWLNNLFVLYTYTNTDQDMVFLIPGSCWTVRNCNSVSADVTEGHHQKWLKLATRRDRKAHQRFVFLPVSKVRTNKFYILRQYMYIVNVISLSWHFLRFWSRLPAANVIFVNDVFLKENYSLCF